LVVFAFSQNTNSYWDTKIASAETVKVKAGESLVLKCRFQSGSRGLYRIKLAETNSEITESLDIYIKSINSRSTGISQGTAGVIFLTTIAGKDKFDYNISSIQRYAAYKTKIY
jgi:hypothetical protein